MIDVVVVRCSGSGVDRNLFPTAAVFGAIVNANVVVVLVVIVPTTKTITNNHCAVIELYVEIIMMGTIFLKSNPIKNDELIKEQVYV